MKGIVLRILAYIRQVLRIEDLADETLVIEFVKRDVDFRGAKAWILIFAILVASLGLNTNSVAVIIGAMLISPLMGPIIGVGVSVGISDRLLLGRSAKNLATAVVISMLTSALFFLISPFDNAGSELLGRTEPTLLDVLIAVAGGAAGAIAMVRQDRSNVVPGVAIATALMPPLCTAGYGLAQLDPRFFFGAFYLFFINSVFIASSTYVVIRILKIDPVVEHDPVRAKRVKRIILAVVILTLIPSIYTGYNMLRRTAFERRVSDLRTACENKFKATSFNVSTSVWSADSSHIVLTLVGEPLEQKELNEVRGLAVEMGLGGAALDIRQAIGMTDVMLSAATEQMRRSVMGDLYDRTLTELRYKDSVIQVLRAREQQRQAQKDLLVDLSREVEQISENVKTITYKDSMFVHGREGAVDTISVAYLSFVRSPRKSELEELQNWLRVRLKSDSLQLIVVH